MAAIASYAERRFDGRRNFELLPDRVVIKGAQSLGNVYENVVMLDTLQPIVSTVRARAKGFGQGIAMVLASLVLIQSGLISATSYWGGLVIVLGIAGLLLSLSTARRVQWARINTKAGVPALSIARSGSQKADFESFVQHVVTQIRVVEGSLGSAVT